MMRSLVALLITLVFAACSAAPAARDQPHPANAAVAPEIESLLTSAATDFHTHRAMYPARLRNVRGGYYVTEQGTRQYRLCGEFLPAQGGTAAQWTPFVTIQTDPYEQWIGGQATPYCDSTVRWNDGDLSALLQSRLDALAATPAGT